MTVPGHNRHKSGIPLAWHLLRLNFGSTPPHGVLTVWRLWERWYEFMHPAHIITPHSLLRYARSRAPRTHTFREGTTISAGDPILELHFNNTWLASLGSGTPWLLMKQLHADLLILQQLLTRRAFSDVAALHGTTLFGAPARRFGFEVDACPRTPGVQLERYFMAGLILQYHPDGWNAVLHAARRWPYELWLDRDALMHLA